MNTILTKPRNAVSNYVRARFLRWRLDNVEKDIIALRLNEQLARAEAEQIRCELALLKAL